jgi:hypothetical protein
MGMWDRPPRREASGDGATVVLGGRESRLQGEGWQVVRDLGREVREMRDAETVLGIIRERGRSMPDGAGTLRTRTNITGEPGTPKGVSPVRGGACDTRLRT